MGALPNPPSFLGLLDLLIQLDTAPAGFRGSVCLGVERQGQRSWWIADFSGTTSTRFLEGEWPPEADAVLLMNQEDALRLISTGVIAPQGLQMTGDRKLMKRFISRFLERKNMLSVRFQREV